MDNLKRLIKKIALDEAGQLSAFGGSSSSRTSAQEIEGADRYMINLKGAAGSGSYELKTEHLQDAVEFLTRLRTDSPSDYVVTVWKNRSILDQIDGKRFLTILRDEVREQQSMKVEISESDLKKLVVSEIKNVLSEKTINELNVVSQGSSRTQPNVDKGNEAVTRSESRFLEALAEAVASRLGLGGRVSTNAASTTNNSWDQIDFYEGQEGQLVHNTFITLDKLGEGEYRISADADTRSRDGVEAFRSEYVVIEEPGGLGPDDLTSRFVQTFTDMLEDAEMQGHKSPSYFDPSNRNPRGI